MASLNEETANSVRTQVEFYFSDSNLPRDTFLSKEVAKSVDGSKLRIVVSLPLVCSFSRMRTLLGLGNIKLNQIPYSLVQEVANILSTSEFLKVSGQRVGRATKLSERHKVIQQVDRRTIAASPFEYCTKMEDVASFFSQYAKVNSVRLPPHIGDKQHFCGTALVEFSSEQDTDDILNQTLVYAGADLALIPKTDFDRKRERMVKKLEKSGSSLKDASHNKGQILRFTLKRISPEGKVTKKDDNKKNREKEDKVGTSEDLQGEDHNKESGDSLADKSCANLCNVSGEKVDYAEKPETAPLNSSDSLGSEVLKDALQRFGSVKHLEYSNGLDTGYVCFINSETATKARAAVEFVGGLVLRNKFSVALEAVNGEMEREVWKRLSSAEPEEEGEEGRKEADDKKTSILMASSGEIEREVWKRQSSAESEEEGEEGSRKEADDKKGKGKGSKPSKKARKEP